MLGIALRDTGLGLPDLRTLARAADDAGFDSIWLPEVGSRDAIVLSSFVGSDTRRASVGTGVVPLYSRGPVTLALAAATACEATRGRFVLGIGAGHPFTATAWYGGSWHRPRTRLRETIDVVRRILAGERVSHHGEIKVDGFQLSSGPHKVPVYVGALSPASLRLAGEVADGAILNWMPAEASERSALLVREAAADAGRSARVVSYVRTAVVHDADDLAAARAAVREQVYAYLSLPAYASSVRAAGLGPQLDAMVSGDERALDELVDELCACGEPDAVRSKLAGWESVSDAAIVYPVPFGDDPVAGILRTIRSLKP